MDHAPTATSPAVDDALGLVLTGGGARGAYQVGVLKWVARNYPHVQPPIITGVSAGAVNTAKLASAPGSFSQACEETEHLWRSLEVDNVFRVGASSIMRSSIGWAVRLMSGGSRS